MKNLLFIPVFKTKRTTEKYIIEKLSNLFSDNFFPLIEWTKDHNDSSVKKYNSLLKNLFHLESYFRKSSIPFEEIIDKTIKLRKNNRIIPCLKILPNECKKEYNLISNFIKNEKKKGLISLNISIENDINTIIQIGNELSKDDYLIIDIGNNNINYIKSLKLIKDAVTNNTQIIILSEERNTTLNDNIYSNFGYNDGLFDFSTLDLIRNNKFDFNGFASYCTLKNDLTGDDQKVTKSYATIFLYDYYKNDIFTIRTNESNNISTSYINLTNYIINSSDIKNTINSIIKKSQLAKEVFNDICSKEKGAVTKYQELSALNYIESVIYILNSN